MAAMLPRMFVPLTGAVALRLNGGPLPWWITSRARRVPGTKPSDYLAYGKLMFAGRWLRPNRR